MRVCVCLLEFSVFPCAVSCRVVLQSVSVCARARACALLEFYVFPCVVLCHGRVSVYMSQASQHISIQKLMRTSSAAYVCV